MYFLFDSIFPFFLKQGVDVELFFSVLPFFAHTLDALPGNGEGET